MVRFIDAKTYGFWCNVLNVLFEMFSISHHFIRARKLIKPINKMSKTLKVLCLYIKKKKNKIFGRNVYLYINVCMMKYN